MIIRKYEESDINNIFDLMKIESEEWEYAYKKNQIKYIKAMNNSIAYVIIDKNKLCGYIRCKDDDGFGIYFI